MKNLAKESSQNNEDRGQGIRLEPGEDSSESTANPNQSSSTLGLASVSRHNRINPRVLTPANILALQRTIGNKAVTRLLQKNSRTHLRGENFSKAKSATTSNPPKIEATAIQRYYDPANNYEQAKQNHNEDRQKITEIVNAGVNNAGDPILQNTSKWLLSNVAKPAVKAFTKTHDSDQRTGNPEEVAYFGVSAVIPPAVAVTYYNSENLNDTTTVKKFPAGARGRNAASNYGGNTVIVEPVLRGDDEVKKTLKHEMQHYADLHTKTGLIDAAPLKISAASQVQEAWQLYQTEYQAYSIQWKDADKVHKKGQRRFDNKAKRDYQVIKTILEMKYSEEFTEEDFKIPDADKYHWTLRQYVIFQHLYSCGGYPKIKAQWDRECEKPNLSEREFQKNVVDYVHHASNNPYNSPNLHLFYIALEGSDFNDSKLPEELERDFFGEQVAPNKRLTQKECKALLKSAKLASYKEAGQYYPQLINIIQKYAS